jgi:hypothetical protein
VQQMKCVICVVQHSVMVLLNYYLVPSDIEFGGVPEAATSSVVPNLLTSSAILDFVFSGLAAETNTKSPGFSPFIPGVLR